MAQSHDHRSSRAPVTAHLQSRAAERAASAQRRCATRSWTSECRRCARATCRPSSSNAMEPFYPLHACVCEQLLPGAARGVRRRRRTSSPSTPTSRRTRTRWVAHARDYVDMAIERFGLGARQPGGRARQQRRLPAPALRRARVSRRSASSRRPTSPTAAREQGHRRRSCEFFGARARRATSSPRAAGRPDRRQQRAGAGAGPERLRRRHGARARAGRRGHDRVPAPAAPGRGQPVRHDLPRALLVLLVPDRRRRSSRRTA